MKEIWKDIKGYENMYQISNMGRVRSLDRYIILSNNKKIFKKGQIRKISNNGNDYLFVQLGRGNSNRKYIHRLIGENFMSNPDNKPCINHLDSNKNNNKIENLEYVSHTENLLYAYEKNERRSKPVRVRKNGVTKEFKYSKDAAKWLGTTRSHLCNVLKGKKITYSFDAEYIKEES